VATLATHTAANSDAVGIKDRGSQEKLLPKVFLCGKILEGRCIVGCCGSSHIEFTIKGLDASDEGSQGLLHARLSDSSTPECKGK
jgi:hypothetical protein